MAMFPSTALRPSGALRRRPLRSGNPASQPRAIGTDRQQFDARGSLPVATGLGLPPVVDDWHRSSSVAHSGIGIESPPSRAPQATKYRGCVKGSRSGLPLRIARIAVGAVNNAFAPWSAITRPRRSIRGAHWLAFEEHGRHARKQRSVDDVGVPTTQPTSLAARRRRQVRCRRCSSCSTARRPPSPALSHDTLRFSRGPRRVRDVVAGHPVHRYRFDRNAAAICSSPVDVQQLSSAIVVGAA